MQWQTSDSAVRYGSVTRMLHWGMALLLCWQFVTTLVRVSLPDTALYDAIWPTHRSLGFLLLVLMLVRLGWAWANRTRRPPAVSAAARAGHLTLYGLLIVVPVLALLRQFGSGRAYTPFGIPVMSGFEGERIEWMVAAGNLFHGGLGWTLLALILGHVAMAFWHRRQPTGGDVLARMR